MAESGGGVEFLGMGSKQAPSPPAKGSGERCKLAQWGRGQSSGKMWLWCISGLEKSSNLDISRLSGRFQLSKLCKKISHFTIGGGGPQTGQVRYWSLTSRNITQMIARSPQTPPAPLNDARGPGCHGIWHGAATGGDSSCVCVCVCVQCTVETCERTSRRRSSKNRCTPAGTL